jgi:predicted PurR-regulated permease PerM
MPSAGPKSGFDDDRMGSSDRAVHPTTYPKAIAVVATVAALYFGRDIFIPLAIAVLLTFALAPLVSFLRKFYLPRPVAAVTVVIGAFASIFLFGAIVASQLGTLAQNLPIYQNNIETKVKAIRGAYSGPGVFDRLSTLFDRLGREIQSEEEETVLDTVPEDDEPKPLPVEVVEPALKPLQVLLTVVGPLIEPLATGGIIVVVVIFMLLRREDLRDRFIRLVGAGDLHRTTEALQDAGSKVGQYLLMQMVVNLTYAIPITIGLFIIGVPNALLWGMLTLVLRFVPYIGPIIAAIFPLTLALAVDSGWTMLFWTAALFMLVELISNNIVEPWLYGSRTGLSPLAIIVAAIFWTWLWGPLGLLLSTPLTVCLVVLGRHVPQFEFLDVLFGNEPVLDPHQQLYQRLLAGDPEEATDRAELFLEENRLVTFYETVAMPALALGEEDRARGVMSDERRRRVADSALDLVSNLEDYAEEEAEELENDAEAAVTSDAAEPGVPATPLPSGKGRVIVAIGGRGDLDDAAAAMVAQVLAAQGATARFMLHDVLEPGKTRSLPLAGVDSVLLVYLNPQSQQHSRYMVRRFKRAHPSMRVGVMQWNQAPGALDTIKHAAEIGSDFFAASVADAATQALLAGKDVVGPNRRKRARRVVAKPAKKEVEA